MIVRLGEARADKRHLVDVLAQVREDLGDILASWLNRNGDFISPPTASLKNPVVFLKAGSNSLMDLPSHRASAGL